MKSCVHSIAGAVFFQIQRLAAADLPSSVISGVCEKLLSLERLIVPLTLRAVMRASKGRKQGQFPVYTALRTIVGGRRYEVNVVCTAPVKVQRLCAMGKT